MRTVGKLCLATFVIIALTLVVAWAPIASISGSGMQTITPGQRAFVPISIPVDGNVDYSVYGIGGTSINVTLVPKGASLETTASQLSINISDYSNASSFGGGGSVFLANGDYNLIITNVGVTNQTISYSYYYGYNPYRAFFGQWFFPVAIVVGGSILALLIATNRAKKIPPPVQ